MDFFGKIFDRFSDALKSVLPQSPFKDFLADFADIPYLGYLNWFVPVKGILVVMGAWLGAISFFHLYSIVMRWLKVLGD